MRWVRPVKDETQWHRKFCLRPRRRIIKIGSQEYIAWIWLGFYECRENGSSWQFRLPPKRGSGRFHGRAYRHEERLHTEAVSPLGTIRVMFYVNTDHPHQDRVHIEAANESNRMTLFTGDLTELTTGRGRENLIHSIAQEALRRRSNAA